MTPRGWIGIFVISGVGMGGLGLTWSDWFLIAGSIGSLAAAAYLVTQPTKS